MKPWLRRLVRSRTIIFNAVMAGGLALEASFGLLQPLLPANSYAVGCVLLAVGNAVLRALAMKQATAK
jgi:hypothetical protein